MLLNMIGMIAIASSLNAPPVVIEHCIEKTETHAPYCFLESVTPRHITLLVRIQDIQNVYETPFLIPDARSTKARVVSVVSFSMDILPDDAYFNAAKNALGGFLHQPWQRDPRTQRIAADFTTPYGFLRPATPTQSASYPTLINPYLMASSANTTGNYWNSVVGTMIDTAISTAAVFGSAGAYAGALAAGPAGLVVGGAVLGSIGLVVGAYGAHDVNVVDQPSDRPAPDPNTGDGEATDASSHQHDDAEGSENHTDAPATNDPKHSTPNPDGSAPISASATTAINTLLGTLDQLQIMKIPITPGTPIIKVPPKIVIPRISLRDMLILHDRVASTIQHIDATVNINKHPGYNSLINPGLH